MNKFYVHCTNHMVQKDRERILEAEIEDSNDEDFGSLERIEKIASLVGKRVYNKVDGATSTRASYITGAQT